MKLILSRKGFDGAAGGKPSPIFWDGTMSSLPIPGATKSLALTYDELAGNCWASVGALVHQLKGRVQAKDCAHLDPDLSVASMKRMEGWRPLFGQVGSAESVLQNQKVGNGDVFLFFGLFRHVEKVAGCWRYVPKSRLMHVIFGWLQIEKRVIVSDSIFDETWMLYHPHFEEHFKLKYKNNVVYVAAERLKISGLETKVAIPGAGLFPIHTRKLQLTEPGCSRPGLWLLPSWFYHDEPLLRLGFHRDNRRWRKHSEGVQLSTVGKGQEFVLDCDHYQDAIPWLCSLFNSFARDSC